MTDNNLFLILVPLIRDNLASMGYPGVSVQQNYVPLGANQTGPCVYLHKISDKPVGFPRRSDVMVDGQLKTRQRIEWETTFQVGCLTSVGRQASDILNAVVFLLNSMTAVKAFTAAGLGVLRIGNIRTGYFKDDSNEYAMEPSFDVVITHYMQHDIQELMATGFETEIVRI